jgi:hypothetical protein
VGEQKSQNKPMKLPSCLVASILTVLGAVGANAATITYEFTAGSLAPTSVGVPGGVTASDFVIQNGFTLTDNGVDPNSIRFFATDVGGSSSAAFPANQYVQFSVTIAAGTIVNLTSLSLNYTSTVPVANLSNSRVYSTIDGREQIVEDTIGTLGKAANGSQGPANSTMSLSAPEGNAGRGVNVTNGEFTALTNTTVTFFMPWIDNETGTNYTDVHDITLTFDVVPEPSSMLLGALGLLPFLRRTRKVG